MKIRLQHLYNPNRTTEIPKEEWDKNPRWKIYWKESTQETVLPTVQPKKIKIPKEVEDEKAL